MKIYTRTGDDGGTALFGGARVRKDHARVRAYGALDEANAVVGLAAATAQLTPRIHAALVEVMSDLFDVGAELATPDDALAKLGGKLTSAVNAGRIAALEAAIDEASAALPPLTTFVLPSGTEGAARLHVARTVVRRAERELVALIDDGVAVRPDVLTFINRLSDALFVWARLENHEKGVPDVAWRAQKAPAP